MSEQPEINIDGVDIQWDSEKGTFKFFGIPSALFWINPSLLTMLRPLEQEVGRDLFQLLIAQSASTGTEEDYHTMVTVLGDTFEEGFLKWGAAVSSAGWGTFELPFFDMASKTARVRVSNTWELLMQKDIAEHWGCPFIQGKLIGIFSHALGTPCWADEATVSYDPDNMFVEFEIYESSKTIEMEIKRQRATQRHDQEHSLSLKVDDKTAELKKVNDQLSQANIKADHHFNNTPLAAIDWDLNFCVLDWNQAAEKIFEYSREEALGQHAADLIIPPDVKRKIVEGVFQDLLLMKSGERSTNENLTASGRRIMCEWYNTPIHNAAGDIVGVTSLAQDITEQITIASNLAASEERYRSVVESAADGIIIHDNHGQIIDVNDACCTSTGYARDELMTMTVADIETNASNEGLERLWQQAEEGSVQLPLTVNGEQTRKNGTKFPVEVRLGKLSINDQKLFIAIVRDVTKRNLAERSVRESELKFRSFYDVIPDVFMMTSLEGGHCIDVNDGFCQVTGYRRDNVINKRVEDLQLWEHASDRNKLIEGLDKNGSITNFAGNFRRKNGTIWPGIMSACVIQIDGVSHVLSSTKDVSEIRRSEIEAIQASKAKSDFLANMSHELRTPLNAIIGFSDTMRSEVFGTINEKYMEYASDIYNSGNHLLELINDILDVSAIEAGKLELDEENLEVSRVVRASLVMITSRANAGGVQLSCHVDDGLSMLHADKRRFLQILLNLMSNAVKFTLPDGEVKLSMSLNGAGAYLLTVMDTGIGMDEDELIKAMTKFGQVDSGHNRKYEGSGLGLSLTKGLVELHGGTLDIASKKGKGTTVTVLFPPERTIRSS